MNRLEKYIIATVVTTAVFFLIWYFSTIVIYILISFVLSLIGKPVMDRICKIELKGHTLPRWMASTVVMSMLVVAAVILWQLFVPVIIDKFSFISSTQISDLREIIQKPLTALNNSVHDILGQDLEIDSSELIHEASSRVQEIITATLKNFGSLIDFATSLFVAIFSIFFITFFFLKEDRLFRTGLLMLFPVRFENKVNTALMSSISLLSKYFLALVAESTIKLIIITGGFVIYGLEFSTALLVGLISAVLNVIPYIGPLIGAILGVMLALLNFSGDPASLITFSVILFGAFQLFDNLIIQPYMYSTSVKAHPLEIFLIILLAGSVGGAMGMLLAIPVYTIIRVVAKEFFNNLRVVQKLTEKIDE